MVAAARLNQRATVQTKTVSRSAMGAETEVWSDLATVWAERRELSGQEYFRANQLEERGDVVFTMRYMTGFDEEARIVCDGVTYEVIGRPVDLGARRKWIEIRCRTGVRDAIG